MALTIQMAEGDATANQLVTSGLDMITAGGNRWITALSLLNIHSADVLVTVILQRTDDFYLIRETLRPGARISLDSNRERHLLANTNVIHGIASVDNVINWGVSLLEIP